MLAVAVVGWIGCFVILRRTGTWWMFGTCGALLAALMIATDRSTRQLLRPSFGHVAVGLCAGISMVALTHLSFRVVVGLAPEVQAETDRLFQLLRVGDYSPALRTSLIVLVASSEEIIFRGPLLGAFPAAGGRLFENLGRRELLWVLGLAVVYALATAALGSWLLVLCAWVCAIVWGALRVASRSLVVPILTHVVWDVGVLVVFPIVPP